MDHLPRAHLISTLIAQQVRMPGFTARAHSVFHGALNLAVGEQLLTIATPALGGVPNGIVLDTGDDFVARGIVPGMLLRGNGACLRFAGSAFAVDLAPGVSWSPDLAAIGVLRPPQATAAVLAASLPNGPPRGGFRPLLALVCRPAVDKEQPLPVLSARARDAIADVLQALETRKLCEAVEAARRLIGLGDGLTPSGDDFLVGLTAVLRATEHDLARPFAAACATHARGRTTRIAQMFLEYAARGAYAARLHELIAALRADVSDDCLARAMANTLRWGETSGADCLLGVLSGMTLARGRSSIGVS